MSDEPNEAEETYPPEDSTPAEEAERLTVAPRQKKRKKKYRESEWSSKDIPRTGFEVFLEDLSKKLEPLGGTLRLGLGVFAVFAVLFTCSQAIFQLEPEEEALVLRFGKPKPEVFGPGLHFMIPFVDRVYRAPVNRQQRLEFGFRGKVSSASGTQFHSESLMLTGDLMLVHVRWSLVYKIEDIHAWLFKIKGRESTIRDISMGVMRQVVGDYSLEETLTTKQLEIAAFAHEATQAALRENVPTGVVITEVAIKTADVPEDARQAFDDLTRTLAKVQGDLAVAKTDQDNSIGVARNKKNELIGQAEKVRTQVIENARGEAVSFLAKAAEYERAPEITRQWMYLQTMTSVLAALDEKLVIEDGEGSGIAKHLPLKDFFPPNPGGTR
jgi:membrane protease subunit HflK